MAPKEVWAPGEVAPRPGIRIRIDPYGNDLGDLRIKKPDPAKKPPSTDKTTPTSDKTK